MKKVLISSALAASLAIPSLAFEIYSDDDTKVNLYGSIRGYIGGSYLPQQEAHSGGYLVGLQNNSQFGMRFSQGNFKANIEFGWIEEGNNPGLRKFWGSYTTSAGEILFGKTDTPSTDTGFSSNWFNIDNGMQGFGGVYTGNRKAQLQYNVGGLSLALVSDNYAVGTSSVNEETPRISLGYTIKGEKGAPFFKFAGNYKHLNGNTPAGYSQGAAAWDIWAGLRPTFGNAWLSVMVNHGVNAHIYGAQTTLMNTGGYTHDNVFDSNTSYGASVKRTGGSLEVGFGLGEKLSLALGAGYQATYGGTLGGAAINGAAGFINLPYKVSANFTFVPQVAYYNTWSGSGVMSSSVLAAARIKWDF
uniref:Porin n=1 Tax=uncultured Helicobacter sp. TaxID=175537 RepID=A0A650EMD9_9HELI|nr:hypothetical protein Helico5904_1330 [uncultured Helicobacter sp.]